MSNFPQKDDWLETYKSLVTLATEGFKYCALTNGGAAVAILAYLGNLTGKGCVAPNLSTSMAFFLSGLVLCGLAMLFAYFTQLTRLNLLATDQKPRIRDWRLCVAALFFMGSILAFTSGSWCAVNTFKEFKPHCCSEKALTNITATHLLTITSFSLA